MTATHYEDDNDYVRTYDDDYVVSICQLTMQRAIQSNKHAKINLLSLIAVAVHSGAH